MYRFTVNGRPAAKEKEVTLDCGKRRSRASLRCERDWGNQRDPDRSGSCAGLLQPGQKVPHIIAAGGYALQQEIIKPGASPFRAAPGCF